jgi:hypothetical protein
MNKNEDLPFIFYLTLDENLQDTFYYFDKSLRERGFTLVPVKVDQLQKLVSFSDQSDAVVLCSVKDMKEQRLYNELVRGLLKFVLKNKRISFIHLSSFSSLNDSRQFTMTRNYFFIKYPQDVAILSLMIARYYALRGDDSRKWPGGKRIGLGVIT